MLLKASNTPTYRDKEEHWAAIDEFVEGCIDDNGAVWLPQRHFIFQTFSPFIAQFLYKYTVVKQNSQEKFHLK